MKLHNNITNQQGVVALITSIIVGLLLIVITTSAVGLMSKELTQSTDFDQSVRAYYAAESGLEDAIAKIENASPLSNLLGNNGAAVCNAGNLGTNVSYTCQRIYQTSNQSSGHLLAEEAVRVDLVGAASYDRIKVSWNRPGASASVPDPSTVQMGSVPANYPPGSNWYANGKALYPAVMDVTMINYPATTGGATFTTDDIGSWEAVLKPTNGAFTGPFSVNNNGLKSVGCQQTTDSEGYTCIAILTVDSTKSHSIQLVPHYNNAFYRIQACNDDACINPVSIPNSDIIIDVTGKAGNAFRRVRALLPQNPQPGLPYVLFADETICKVFSVRGGIATATDGCEPF